MPLKENDFSGFDTRLASLRLYDFPLSEEDFKTCYFDYDLHFLRGEVIDKKCLVRDNLTSGLTPSIGYLDARFVAVETTLEIIVNDRSKTKLLLR